MYSFDVQAVDPKSPAAFVARGRAPHRGSEFVVTGALNQDGEANPGYSLWLRFVPSHYNTYNIYFTGEVNNDGAIFSGSWGTSQHDMPFTFEFRRIPAEVMVCRPAADIFRNNRAAALWSFALTAVRAQVLRSMRSTCVLAQRRRKKREWEVFVAGEPLDACELFRTTTFADACYYYTTLLHRNVVHKCAHHFVTHCCINNAMFQLLLRSLQTSDNRGKSALPRMWYRQHDRHVRQRQVRRGRHHRR